MFTYEKYCVFRDAKNLTDYKVSCASGVSRTTISEWKKGRYQPKIDSLIKIGKVLDIPLEVICDIGG